MRIVPSTRGIAGASARHPWKTIGLWIAMIVIAGVLSTGVGSRFNDEDDFTNNPESARADALLDQHMNDQPLTETIVFDSTSRTIDDPVYRAAIEQTTVDLRAMTGVVASVSNYFEIAAEGDPASHSMVSADRKSTFMGVVLEGDYEDLSEHGAEFVAIAQGRSGDGIASYAVGDISGDVAYGKIAEEDLAKSEIVGLPVALLVLVVVFGALLAPVLPILLGMLSIFVAVGLTAVLTHFMNVTEEVTIMTTMIGLAVGIDYALFMIERYREERRRGLSKQDAIEFAGGTAGKAICFSGGTVILALLGMFLLPITVFHSLASGAILAVLVSMIATQTFIPALLSLLGDRINFPRRTPKANTSQPLTVAHSANIYRGFWGRITKLVMARPVVSMAFALTVLIGLALPALTLRTGVPGLETLPPTDVKSGYEILATKFYAGVISPVEIVVDGDPDADWVTAGVANLSLELSSNPLFGSLSVQPSDDGAVTIIQLPIGADPQSRVSYRAIETLRDEIVPAAFGNNASQVLVGGDSAGNLDFNTVLKEYAPRVFLFVLGLSFLLLMLAFRSLIVPLKAIVMNLLSVGAAYGVLVLVFQHGVGAGLLGVQQTESITSWLPIFLFCVLFGLSMDYHVFLLSRIREHYDLTHDNEESVAVGLHATGKIITGAALIMVAVFGAFAAGRLAEFQQMGLGLAVAVFLDATIVRTILVPSAMKLLGNANWYLPNWLSWLPDLRIEGSPDLIISPAGSTAD